jgi:hypothetical protein
MAYSFEVAGDVCRDLVDETGGQEIRGPIHRIGEQLNYVKTNNMTVTTHGF